MNEKGYATGRNSSGCAPEEIQIELDKRLFHLKTLYEVSHELLGAGGGQEILKNFLLMTTGNFGVVEGFVLTQDAQTDEVSHFEAVGLETAERETLARNAGNLRLRGNPGVAWLRENSLRRFGFLPPSIVCGLAFCVDETCSGLLGLGAKLTGEAYSEEDRELLKTLVNNLVISLANARASEALREAYEEVSSLNRAKDKVINHLSHELKTPLALISGSITILERKLESGRVERWERSVKRAKQALERLYEMQYEVEDIMSDCEYEERRLLSHLLDRCADHLEVLVAEKIEEEGIVEAIRERIEDTFGPRECPPQVLRPAPFVRKKIREIQPFFSRRQLEVITKLENTPQICMPIDPLAKIITGLIRNAVENTPDGGRIEVALRHRGKTVEMIVRDTGVGIRPEHQRRIFEGFFPTQETSDYSSKKPFDFNAGGKGADLLRMKIFSERFNFKIEMSSSRCGYLQAPEAVCPGTVEACPHCDGPEPCYFSGGTVFRVHFPAVS